MPKHPQKKKTKKKKVIKAVPRDGMKQIRRTRKAPKTRSI
jgi:hypothetical protein